MSESQTGTPSVDAEITRNVVLWLMISISPLSAGVATLTTLLDSQTALTMTMTLSNGTSATSCLHRGSVTRLSICCLACADLAQRPRRQTRG